MGRYLRTMSATIGAPPVPKFRVAPLLGVERRWALPRLASFGLGCGAEPRTYQPPHPNRSHQTPMIPAVPLWALSAQPSAVAG